MGVVAERSELERWIRREAVLDRLYRLYRWRRLTRPIIGGWCRW